jgi:hypothetical protein
MNEASNPALDPRIQGDVPAGSADRTSGMFLFTRRYDVPCTIDIERTREQLYAHVTLEDILVDEGDEVTVHNAPNRVTFGEHVTMQSSATVIKASAFGRYWTRLKGYFEITELYEVGFQPKE